jgi:hypothetical protein
MTSKDVTESGGASAMIGRRKASEEEMIAMDAALEADLTRVERSIAAYLQDPSDARRQSLSVVLEELDDQTAQSDAYEDSIVGSGAWGYASKGEVLGETSASPVVEEVPNALLGAQVALVKAAKREVRGPTPETLAVLRSASAALDAIRSQRDIR